MCYGNERFRDTDFKGVCILSKNHFPIPSEDHIFPPRSMFRNYSSRIFFGLIFLFCIYLPLFLFLKHFPLPLCHIFSSNISRYYHPGGEGVVSFQYIHPCVNVTTTLRD
jgi:hypothetical protein